MKLHNLKLSVMIDKFGCFSPSFFLSLRQFSLLLASIVFCSLFPWDLGGKTMFSSAIVFAQTLTPEKVAEAVYQQIPDFPLANNYTSLSNNQVALDNTLVGRLVRYHQYIKARPTIYRLDWKLTLADYLRKNEMIDEQRYPGNGTLTQNPLENDRQIIEKLTIQQRDNLVNVLVSIYNPSVNANPEDKPQTTPTPNNSKPPSTIILPTPGGADLLLP